MKNIYFVLMIAFFTLLLTSCGKNPVGPALSSLSSGVNSASSSSSSAAVTTNASNTSGNGGASGVGISENNTVSSASAGTGVSAAEASTGVSAATFSSNGSSQDAGSASSMTFAINNNITHFYIPSVFGNPRIYWDASGVNQSYQKVRITISKMDPIKGYWEINDVARNKGSVIYGDAKAGTVVTAAVPLDRGSYSIYISVYDNETSNNNAYGGGNFVVQ